MATIVDTRLSSCDATWSASAERVGQGEVGGFNKRVKTVWSYLYLAIERPWCALGVLFPSFVQMGV